MFEVRRVEDMFFAFVQLHRRGHLRRDGLNIVFDVTIHPLLIDEDAVVVIREQIADDRGGHVDILVDFDRAFGASGEFFFDLTPFFQEQPQVGVERFGVFALGHRPHDDTEAFGQKHLGERTQAAAFFGRGDFFGDGGIIGQRHQHQEAPGQRDVARNAASFIRDGLFDDLDEDALIALEPVRRSPLRTSASAAASAVTLSFLRAVFLVVVAMCGAALGRAALAARLGVGYVMFFVRGLGVAVVFRRPFAMAWLPAFAHRALRLGGALSPHPMDNLDLRVVLIDVFEQRVEVLGEVREVEERVLFLPDIYKGRLNARHDAPNAAQVDVAQGTCIVRVFEVQLRQIAFLNDGDAGLFFFCVDDNFFGHAEGRCARSSGGLSVHTRRGGHVCPKAGRADSGAASKKDAAEEDDAPGTPCGTRA